MVRWNLVSFVKRSSQRTKILQSLQDPTTPSQLSKKTGLYITHVSRTLGELTEKGLAECLTPEERVEKYYRITKLGKDVLSDMSKMKKEE